MAIDVSFEQPQPVINVKDDPDKMADDINRAIQVLMRNLELLREKGQEAP